MSETATQTVHAKLRLSLRSWLLGRGYTLALKAMDFAERHHTGQRKNGDPEFAHQIWQCHYLRSLEPSLLYPEETFAVTFLHDVVEDYPVTLAEIEDLFGSQVAHSTGLMSKVIEGEKKDANVYFDALSQDPIASVCKGADRIHNHKTMIGAFSSAKQIDYLGETEDDIMRMLKDARRRHPEQELVYANIKHMLIGQMELLSYANEAAA
jgi:(p)ppGpp synthase/HD superfamily hydrolase